MSKRYQVSVLTQLLTQIFERLGVAPDESQQLTTSLIDADLRGIRSHGVQRTGMYVKKLRSGQIKPDQSLEVVRNEGAVAVIDGHFGVGQHVAITAMKLAIEKAQATGVGIVSVRQSNHFGAAGYYARLASAAGMIGVAMTNTNPLTVPTHGHDAFLGSNPIAVAVPATPHDFIFDAAMSTVSLGKFEMLKQLDRPVPGTWALDEHGEVTHDAGRLLQNMNQPQRDGGVLPIGGVGETDAGYKGYGLALIVELLTAGLAQGPFSADLGRGQVVGISHFFMAIDPAWFGDATAIKQRVSELLLRLRQLPVNGVSQVSVAGDHEWAAVDVNRQRGIALEPATVAMLKQVTDSLNIKMDLV